jgi:hypothetical protein
VDFLKDHCRRLLSCRQRRTFGQTRNEYLLPLTASTLIHFPFSSHAQWGIDVGWDIFPNIEAGAGCYLGQWLWGLWLVTGTSNVLAGLGRPESKALPLPLSQALGGSGFEDPWATLGVSVDADDKQIKRAYRKLVLKCAPCPCRAGI